MPTYEYQCKKCHKHFDRLQRMSEKPLKACVYCQGPVERLIGSGVGFIFKGSGFYATDYKKNEKPAPGKSDRGSDQGLKGKASEKSKEVQKESVKEPKKNNRVTEKETSAPGVSKDSR